MNFNRRGGVGLDAVDYGLMLLVSIITLLAYIGPLYVMDTIQIDDRTLDTQLVLNKITREKCFSDEYGLIKESSYTQKALDDCLSGLGKDTWVLVQVEKEKGYYSFSKESEFKDRSSFCYKGSSILCTQAVYPVRYINAKNEEEVRKMTIQVLVT